MERQGFEDIGNRKVRSLTAFLSHASIILGMLILLIAGTMALSVPQQAFAEDELYLTGIVKSVNPGTGIVYVEVVSASCNGMRMFRADKLDELQKYIEQKISFFIDSDHCSADSVPVILVSRGISK
jgi:hypothetical protein